MRLFLLPISSRRNLIYCQRINQVTSRRLTLVDRATSRAAQLWVQWEKSDKRWQKSITEYGNKVFRRIPYEEWGLKSIPPLSTRRKAEELQGRETAPVSVTFPAARIPPGSINGILKTLATERQALHWKRLWWSVVGMPITAPIALIPVIPNLPFFYLVFRAWSHWRAYSGSKHIEFLVDNNLLLHSPSTALDRIYAARSGIEDRPPTNEPKADRAMAERGTERPAAPGNETADLLLLQESDGKLIADQVKMPELAVEVERAVRQVRVSSRAKADLREEKQGLDGATTQTKEEKR